jgi:hypothetical protein
MTKRFCDACGYDASDGFPVIERVLKERFKFRFRGIFELVEEFAPSDVRVSPADICNSCMAGMLSMMKEKLKTNP